MNRIEIKSEITSTSDVVRIALGAFNDCIRVVRKIDDAGIVGDKAGKWLFGIRTIWFAPGIGIVKTVYEPEAHPPITAELESYHIAGGEGYLPLAVGNWWNYGWVEGEKQYGFKTRDYIEVTRYHEETQSYNMMGYITCMKGRD